MAALADESDALRKIAEIHADVRVMRDRQDGFVRAVEKLDRVATETNEFARQTEANSRNRATESKGRDNVLETKVEAVSTKLDGHIEDDAHNFEQVFRGIKDLAVKGARVETTLSARDMAKLTGIVTAILGAVGTLALLILQAAE